MSKNKYKAEKGIPRTNMKKKWLTKNKYEDFSDIIFLWNISSIFGRSQLVLQNPDNNCFWFCEAFGAFLGGLSAQSPGQNCCSCRRYLENVEICFLFFVEHVAAFLLVLHTPGETMFLFCSPNFGGICEQFVGFC